MHFVIQGCSRTGRSGRWASKIAEARARARYEWCLGPKLEVCATGRCSFNTHSLKTQLVASSYYLVGHARRRRRENREEDREYVECGQCRVDGAVRSSSAWQEGVKSAVCTFFFFSFFLSSNLPPFFYFSFFPFFLSFLSFFLPASSPLPLLRLPRLRFTWCCHCRDLDGTSS